MSFLSLMAACASVLGMIIRREKVRESIFSSFPQFIYCDWDNSSSSSWDGNCLVRQSTRICLVCYIQTVAHFFSPYCFRVDAQRFNSAEQKEFVTRTTLLFVGVCCSKCDMVNVTLWTIECGQIRQSLWTLFFSSNSPSHLGWRETK